MKNIEWKTCFKIGLSVVIVYLFIHYLENIGNFFAMCVSAATPIFIGLIMAYTLNILMSFYERHFLPKSKGKIAIKLRRPVCLLAAVATLLGVVALIVCLVTPQLIECLKMVVDGIPAAIEKLVLFLEKFDIVPEKIISSLNETDWKSKIGEFSQTIFSGVGSAVTIAYNAISSVFSVASALLIGFIFALYLLLEKTKLCVQLKRTVNHFLPEKFVKSLTYVSRVANDCFHHFIVGQCTEAVILGTLCLVGMLILRLPYAPMISALIGFTALIPIVGAFLGAAVGAFLIFTISPTQAIIFLVFVVILQQIEGNFIYPKVVGSSIGLPGIWVLAAVTIGGGVMGIPGMMIGVPLVATVYKLIKNKMNDDVQQNTKKTTDTVSATIPEVTTTDNN